MGKQLYWLTGDDFVCVERKNKIISDLQKKHKQIDIVHLEDPHADTFNSALRETSLFGSQEKVIVCSGKIPDYKKIKKYMEPLSPSIYLIFYKNDKIREDSSFSKKYKTSLEYYEPLILSNGYPNKDAIPNGIETIKKITKTNYHYNMYLYILENVGYDYGLCISELKRIAIILGEDAQKDDVDKLLFFKNEVEYDTFLASLSERDLKSSLENLNCIFKNSNFEEIFILFINRIQYHFNFFLNCKLALEDNEIAGEDFIIDLMDIMRKNKEMINEKAIRGKFYYNREYIKSMKMETINYILSCLNVTTTQYLEGVYNTEYLAKKLTTQICLG